MSCQKSKVAGHACGCLAKPAEVADLLETSARNLFRWRAERDFPRPDAGGRLDLREVIAWLVADARKRGEIGPSEKDERAKLLAARRRRLELQNTILEGRFIDRAEVESDIMAKLYAFRGGLDMLNRSLGRDLLGLPTARAIEAKIKERTDDLCAAFASGWEPTAADAEAGEIPKHVEDAESSGGVAGEKIGSVEKEA